MSRQTRRIAKIRKTGMGYKLTFWLPQSATLTSGDIDKVLKSIGEIIYHINKGENKKSLYDDYP